MPISPNTIHYYYIYGSVLAALSRPRENRCDEAMRIMGDVRAELEANPDAYADGRETIISIVQAGESICQSLNESLEGGAAPDSPFPTEEGEIMIEVTVTPTP